MKPSPFCIPLTGGLPAILAGSFILVLASDNVEAAQTGDDAVVLAEAHGSLPSRTVRLDPDPTFTRITTGDIVTMNSGSVSATWIDVDDDGDVDLFVSNTFVADALFLNNGDGSFTRSSIAQAGPLVSSAASGDVCWGDYDNDGLPDLYIGPWQQPGVLYHNEGAGSFVRLTSFPMIPASAYPFGATWGDYDNDGFLDLYVGSGWLYGPVESWLLHNERGGFFAHVKNRAVGPIVTDQGFSGHCSWVDYDNDGDLDLFQPNVIGRNALYRNEGDGRFTGMSDAAIALVSDCYTAAWGDYDNDGDLDVFLQSLGYPPSRTGPRKNHLFRNDSGGLFVALTNSPLTSEALRSLHAAWADYDNDGFLDLFVTTDGDNRLYRNEGDGTFTQVTTGSLVRDGGQSWTAAWGDYDNDGFMDLFVANGAANLPEQPFFYRNGGASNRWLKLRLVGAVSNRSAVGAKVRVKAVVSGRTLWQMREVAAPTNHGDQRPNFGLGDATVAETVRIEWPSGIVQELRNVPANQILTVTEPARLEPHVVRADGRVDLHLQSWPGFVYDIEASNDLESWTRLTTRTNETGALSFEDPLASTAVVRFYRLFSR